MATPTETTQANTSQAVTSASTTDAPAITTQAGTSAMQRDAQQVNPVYSQAPMQQNNDFHYGYPMGNYNNNFQPTPQQPLQYPQYGGYYQNQQQYPMNGGFYPPPMPPPMMPPHPPQPQPQQYYQPPMHNNTYQNSFNSGGHGGDADNSTLDGNQSEAGSHISQPEEPQYLGAMANRLDEWAAQQKNDAAEGPEVYERLAGYMTDQLKKGFATQDLDQSIKEFPTLKNVPLAFAPELEGDIFEYINQPKYNALRANELALKSIQRGITSSVNALGPLAEVIMKQCQDNAELSSASTVILDVIKLLSNSMAGLSKKRRDLLRPHIDAKYQKLGKNDEDFDQHFLFGGNISDRARKIKARDSLMKEVMKSDTKPQGSPRKFPNNGGAKAGVSTQRSTPRNTPYPRNQNRAHGGHKLSTSNNNNTNNSDFRKNGSSQGNKRN